MTREQYDKALEINERLQDLEALDTDMAWPDVRLTYVRAKNLNSEEINIYGRYLEDVHAILGKHDQQIRQEIRQLTENIEKEIEAV